jgi:hypothetical protein
VVTQAIPVDQLQVRAAEVRPGRVAATAIGAVFVAIGWVLGRLWMGAVFCCLAARYGYWRGTGLDDGQIAARMAPPEPPPAPKR